MHTVKFFSFRVLTKKGSKHSFNLNAIPTGSGNNIDAYSIVKGFFTKNANSPIEAVLAKSVAYLDGNKDIKFDDIKKLIYGYVEVGSFGESSAVRERQSNKKLLNTLADNTIAKKRYVMIYLPDGVDEGVIAYHSTKSTQASTVLSDRILEEFKSLGLEARISPLVHKQVPRYILDAELTEIKAVGFKPHLDITDAKTSKKTHLEGDFTISNGGSVLLGKFRDLGSKKYNDVIEVVSEASDQVKVKLKIGSRSVTYNYDSIIRKGISIELDKDNLNIDTSTGIPNLSDIHATIVAITNDILKEVHNNNSGVLI